MENSNILLTSCPVCNGQIASDAQSCPHCGHPIKAKHEKLAYFAKRVQKANKNNVVIIKEKGPKIAKAGLAFLWKWIKFLAVMLIVVSVHYAVFPNGLRCKDVIDLHTFTLFLPLILYVPIIISVAQIFGKRPARIIGKIFLFFIFFGTFSSLGAIDTLIAFGGTSESNRGSLIAFIIITRCIWFFIIKALISNPVCKAPVDVTESNGSATKESSEMSPL